MTLLRSGQERIDSVAPIPVVPYTHSRKSAASPAMAKESPPADIAKLGFEDALQQLEDIVRNLEAGKGNLETAIASYERGARLKAHCEAKLAEAQMKIDRIVLGAGGAVKTAPVEPG